MSVNVQAEVVDIRSDTPKPDDTFLVDSNVWVWLTYARATVGISTQRRSQIQDYTSYINKAISAKSLLAYSGFSLAELAHLIEKTERQIFNPSITTKSYRHNYPGERLKVVAQVQSVWSQVKALAASINLTIDESTTDNALTRFSTQLLDGYDLFILETMKKEGIENIITDDIDYVSVFGIRIFTSNYNAISSAGNQGKLVVR